MLSLPTTPRPFQAVSLHFNSRCHSRLKALVNDEILHVERSFSGKVHHKEIAGKGFSFFRSGNEELTGQCTEYLVDYHAVAGVSSQTLKNINLQHLRHFLSLPISLEPGHKLMLKRLFHCHSLARLASQQSFQEVVKVWRTKISQLFIFMSQLLIGVSLLYQLLDRMSILKRRPRDQVIDQAADCPHIRLVTYRELFLVHADFFLFFALALALIFA